ncbi:MAG: sensor histidine kinase [Acidobacteriota bacterium]|nr:sensor histidine kinase [Acidobacteriota bacterium]
MKSSGSSSSPQWQYRFLLFGGFGGMLLLLGVLGLSALSLLGQIEKREEEIRQNFVSRERALENLRSGIYLSGTSLRDFLQSPDEKTAAELRGQFVRQKREVEADLAECQALEEPDERQPYQELKDELNGYFSAAQPVLTWDARERLTRGLSDPALQDEVWARRIAALGIADRIQDLDEKRLEISSEAVSVMLSSFRTRLLGLLSLTVLIGLVLAGVTLWRLFGLEEESRERFREVLNAREELKRLSAEVVSAQENERRRISRELHDEVGQVLSAIVLGIGNLRSALVNEDREESLRQLQLIQDMTERNVSVVRNISLLLRPTMLDDLGLAPALKWLAREVSRRTSMSVEVFVDSLGDDLPEEHRTCVFRVVQEALTNASRHSGARHVRIHVEENAEGIRLSIHDDGKGFAASQERGLGILGMHERVLRLGGTLTVESERGHGATVRFTLPHHEAVPLGQEMRPLRTA